MIVQLNPPLPMETPRGKAVAHFLLDYGLEMDLMWICFQDETGECWTFQNHEIRRTTNLTMGRDTISSFSDRTINRYKRFK